MSHVQGVDEWMSSGASDRRRLAAVLIEDAIHGRMTPHRLDPAALRLYAVFHSRRYKAAVVLLATLNLALALFEPHARAKDARFSPAVVVAEAAIIALLCADVALEASLHVWHVWRRRPWPIIKMGSLSACAVGELRRRVAPCLAHVNRPTRPLVAQTCCCTPPCRNGPCASHASCEL